MQVKSAWEGSALVVDAVDAAAAAPVAGMLWRGRIDLPKAISEKLTIGIDNERKKIKSRDVFREQKTGLKGSICTLCIPLSDQDRRL